jgi:predicted NAD/FAD-binding protein
MNIAVVGGGISGLVCARALDSLHQVTLIEADARLGGHTNTIEVQEGNRSIPVDTGFIVFNQKNYPRFCRLLQELEVVSLETSMSFSVKSDSGLEYCGSNLNTVFAQRRNLFRPRFLGMLREIMRFNRLAQSHLRSVDDDESVRAFLNRHGFGGYFADSYFLPMGAAIWSCSQDTFLDFPMRFILEFFDNHGLLQLRDRPQWRVIQGGSREYVRRMADDFRGKLSLGNVVLKLVRQSDGVTLHTEKWSRTFDHVILACHSNQALKILGEAADEEERRTLAALRYEKNKAVLHTDASLMPVTRRAWASWNYHLRREAPVENRPHSTTVTYWMNRLQNLKCERDYFVSLNETDLIHPSQVITSILYEHPIFNTESRRAQSRHEVFVDRNRVSFCGAYWGSGFHEDGVVSAEAVCRALSNQRAAVSVS